MSGIARVLQGHGRTVSGCDRSAAAIDELRAEGIDAQVGHDPAHLHAGMEVIVSSAVAEDEPELAAARRRGLRVRHRADVLADIVASADGICVAGAHGKTSTSALIAYVLAGVRRGADVPGRRRRAAARHERARRAAAGSSWPRPTSPTARSPACGRALRVVLNAELDHHDHFALARRPARALPRLGRRAAARGRCSCCTTRSTTRALPSCAASARGRGRAGARSTSLPDGEGTRFVLGRPGPRPLPLRLGVPGAHNALNATAALAVLDWAGISPERAAAPLAAFRGAARRYERRGEVAGIRLVDDYAHHPSELAATLAAARGEAAPGRLLACFQPHMPWRTRMFADGFAEALRLADAACVCDVYVARGAADPDVSGELVVQSAPSPGSGLPDRVDAGLRGRRRVGRAHRAARRPRADARRRAGRRRARAGARAADVSAPPPGVEADAALARLTTIGTGGPARFLARPTTAPELAAGAGLGRRARSFAVAVIGLGSNLLVADEGYDGVAVRLEGALAAIEIDGSDVRCGGGASLAAVVRRCDRGRAHRHRVRLRHPRHRRRGGAHERRRLRQRDPRRAELGRGRLGGRRAQRRPARARSELPALQRARHRRSSPRPCSQLEHGARDEIRARVRDMQRRRSESQPRKARTFGSVFKNPDEGPGAGALIEACGLKGHVIGGARISSVHANFIENTGGAQLGRRRGAGLARPALRARALRGRSGARSGAARARQPGLTPPIRVAGGAAAAPKRGACSTRMCSCAAVPPPWSWRRP